MYLLKKRNSNYEIIIYIIMEAKGFGKPVGLMGSLSVSHLANIYFNRGAKGATEKIYQNDWNDNTSNYTSTTHVVHDFD